MNWMLSRSAAAMLAALAGGLLGGVLRGTLGATLLGACIAVALVVLLDGLRARQLIGWLRGPQETPAPRDAGLWGELGYRIERSLRRRERAAEQERARLSQFLSAVEASPNGVLLLDAGDQIEWCSATAADHFGLDPQRDRRQRITNLVRSPAFVAYLQGSNHATPVVMAMPGRRGTLSVLVRRYGEGMRLVLSQDVTERERNETMRRDFVANVSHEIRTPLTVLSGAVETLRELPLGEDERDRLLQSMAQQAQRMQALLSDLLTLAQLEGSPPPGVARWVSLDPLLERVQADASALSAGRHVLRFPDRTGVQIAGDEKELLSAIGNLVGNAVRYTPDGGRIDVTWQGPAAGSPRLSVRDTGIGIERDHLPRLTERFYRVDGSRSRETGGTGLGLSIVKHVMQRHGGALEVDSEPGRGSVFSLVLPAARVREAEPQALPAVGDR